MTGGRKITRARQFAELIESSPGLQKLSESIKKIENYLIRGIDKRRLGLSDFLKNEHAKTVTSHDKKSWRACRQDHSHWQLVAPIYNGVCPINLPKRQSEQTCTIFLREATPPARCFPKYF
jgi:hypothetical protein